MSKYPSNQPTHLQNSELNSQNKRLHLEELMQVRSICSFVKKYFELNNIKYTQIVSADNNQIICRAFIDGALASESREDTFNKARIKASILAMQDHNIDLLKSWLSIHKEELQRYFAA